MTKPIIKIHNITTDEVIEREATAEEIAQIKVDETEAQAKAVAQDNKETAKAALLERLGITEDEAKLLLA